MSDITFDFNPDRLTVDLFIYIEEHAEDRSVRTMRDLLAGLALEPNGETMDFEKAKGIIGRMTLTQLHEAMDRLSRASENVSKESAGEASGS